MYKLYTVLEICFKTLSFTIRIFKSYLWWSHFLAFFVKASQSSFVWNQISWTRDRTCLTAVTWDFCIIFESIKIGNFSTEVHCWLILASNRNNFFRSWLPTALLYVNTGKSLDRWFKTFSFARKVTMLSRTADNQNFLPRAKNFQIRYSKFSAVFFLPQKRSGQYRKRIEQVFAR